MTSTPLMPTDVAAFLHRITAEYENLSRQLKLIARHVEAHRDHLGLEGIQDVAAQCGVQPSAVVRFAKHFGFSGFTEMQRLFRQGLSEQIAPSRNYSSCCVRVRPGSLWLNRSVRLLQGYATAAANRAKRSPGSGWASFQVIAMGCSDSWDT